MELRRPIIEKKYSALEIEPVRELAETDPHELVRLSEDFYRNQVSAAADRIHQNMPGYKMALLCGPSASGKTTTAHKIKQRLIDLGVNARVMSMDDFYTGIASYPLLPDGQPDMESIKALDLNLLNACFSELLSTGHSMFPVFDFSTQTQHLKVHEMTLGDNDILIMEGIHALNPMVLKDVPRSQIFRIYVSVRTKFVDQGDTVLVPKDIRLIRRMVRDQKFRNYPLEHTINYWKHVVASERINIDLYRDEVDLKMDNTIDYEVCVWHSILHSLLERTHQKGYNPYPELETIFSGLERFPELDYGLIPRDSLLREFLGDDL